MKWSQWSPQWGMVRSGVAPLDKLMERMTELGREAAKCLAQQDKPHACYGRKLYNEAGDLVEVRFYSNVYWTDEQMEESTKYRDSYYYVVHKHE